MTGPYLNANGGRISSLDLLVPLYGAPVADIVLTGTEALAAPVTLNVGNLPLTMASLRQEAFAGSSSARLVGGFGGWSKPVNLPPYRNPGGVRLSVVLRDLATAAGERVNLAAGLDRSLGTFYVPETGAQAGRLLTALAGSLWWVDTKGVTQIAGTRPTTTIKSAATVTEYAGGRGWASIGTEDPAAWLPGARYSSALLPDGIMIAALRIKADNDGILRVEALVQ